MTQAVLSRRLCATPPSVHLRQASVSASFASPSAEDGKNTHCSIFCVAFLLFCQLSDSPLARLVPFMSTAGPTRRAKPAKAGGGGKAGAVVGAGAVAAAKPVSPVLPVWRRLLLRNLEWKPVRF